LLVSTTTMAPSPALAAPASTTSLTPVQQAADSFIGKRIGKVIFKGLGSFDFHATGLRGATAGYESLDATVKAAQKINHDERTTAATGTASLVFHVGDRYALMTTDQNMLGRYVWGPDFSADGYKTYRNDAAAALSAVIDGYGKLMPNFGRAFGH
jgi:hypothetical protein